MRFAFPVRALILSIALSTSCFGVQIKQAHMQRHSVEDFQSLSEFFTGKENFGKRLVLRTSAQERAGVYAEIKLDKAASELPAGSQAVLHVIFENNREVQTFTLPISGSPMKTKKLMIGITGKEWKEQAKVVAWHLEIQDASGKLLSEHKSFLWEMPQ